MTLLSWGEERLWWLTILLPLAGSCTQSSVDSASLPSGDDAIYMIDGGEMVVGPSILNRRGTLLAAGGDGTGGSKVPAERGSREWDGKKSPEPYRCYQPATPSLSGSLPVCEACFLPSPARRSSVQKREPHRPSRRTDCENKLGILSWGQSYASVLRPWQAALGPHPHPFEIPHNEGAKPCRRERWWRRLLVGQMVACVVSQLGQSYAS